MLNALQAEQIHLPKFGTVKSTFVGPANATVTKGTASLLPIGIQTWQFRDASPAGMNVGHPHPALHICLSKDLHGETLDFPSFIHLVSSIRQNCMRLDQPCNFRANYALQAVLQCFSYMALMVPA